MKKAIAAAIASLGLGMASIGAHAADVNLVITGQINGQTCTISGNNAQFDKTVPLQPVSATALAAAGNVAGTTDFSLALTGCTGTSVQAKFNQGATVDSSNGNLINQAPGGSSVQVQLLNEDHVPIQLNNNSGLGQTKLVDISSGSATMKFYAQYYAKTANTTVGPVSTNVLLDMLYN